MTNGWDIDDSVDDDWGDEEWDSAEEFPGLDKQEDAELYADSLSNGQRVRDLRMMIDMSPEALADYALINVRDLLAIEAGVLPLERALAQLLADGLGVQVRDIWTEQDKAA